MSPEEFCERCGRQLVAEDYMQRGYEPTTGKRRIERWHMCPTRLSWGFLLLHSAHREHEFEVCEASHD